MAIYLGNTKVSGSGVQADSALSKTSTRPVENKVVTDALEDVGYSTWQKPADWIDIRSGALSNSIYFLVAHSTPTESEGTYTVETYPQFHILTKVSTSGNTYDVYVDGVKVATTVTNTKTVLDWGALYTAGTVSTIYTTTHPSELVYHIVRITPTDSTDTLTQFRNQITSTESAYTQQGILWAHFELSNEIAIYSAFGGETRPRNLLLEAITAKNDNLIYITSSSESSGLYSSFAYCSSLVKLPVLQSSSNQYASGTYLSFRNVPAKKVVIKNNKGNESFYLLNYAQVQEFDVENGLTFSSGTTSLSAASHAEKLKHLPTISNNSGENLVMSRADSLQDTFVDDSSNSTRNLLKIYGTSTYPTRGLKGLIVSSSAPFDGSTPQIDVSYTGLNRSALVNLFKSMPYNVGYTVVGSPTITDGVASGFSTGNYLKTSQAFNPGSAPWEMVAQFTTSDLRFCGIVTGLGSSNSIAISMDTKSSSYGAFLFLSSNGTSWDIAQDHRICNVSANTTYKIKVEFTGAVYNTYLFNNDDWELQNTINSSTPVYGSETFVFGNNRGTLYPFTGTIDLNNTYIKENGIPWFRGTAAMTKNVSVVGCPGTDGWSTDPETDTGADVRAIVENKGWGVTFL